MVAEAVPKKSLQSPLLLPSEWSPPAMVEDEFIADGIELHRVGWTTTSPDGEEVVGSSAGNEGAEADRAFFELLERVSTVEFLSLAPPSCELLDARGRKRGKRAWRELFPTSDEPARWRYARSNGVALHDDWGQAAERAYLELCERDRVLRAWYGETVPRPVPLRAEATQLARAHSYVWLAASFPEPDPATFSAGVEVVGVFGMPRVAEAPLVFGYGARRAFTDAVATAAREAVQLLSFLWKEPIPHHEPALLPTGASHLDSFLWRGRHAILRDWLEGAHGRFHAAGAALGTTPGLARARAAQPVSFVDMTPGWLKRYKVAKAVCEDAVPVTFGDSPFAAHLPPGLRAHPIV